MRHSRQTAQEHRETSAVTQLKSWDAGKTRATRAERTLKLQAPGPCVSASLKWNRFKRIRYNSTWCLRRAKKGAPKTREVCAMAALGTLKDVASRLERESWEGQCSSCTPRAPKGSGKPPCSPCIILIIIILKTPRAFPVLKKDTVAIPGILSEITRYMETWSKSSSEERWSENAQELRHARINRQKRTFKWICKTSNKAVSV